MGGARYPPVIQSVTTSVNGVMVRVLTYFRGLVLVVAVCVEGRLVFAQELERPSNIVVRPGARSSDGADQHANVRSDVNIVLVPVTITNVWGHPVQGLERERFHLFEDGVEHPVKYFSAEDAPLSIAIVFDASASMEPRMAEARQAVERLLLTSIPGDEFLLVQFNTKTSIVQNFTADADKIKTVLPLIRPKGWTALLDAIYLATTQTKRAVNSRKALLVISDGADNRSRHTEKELRNLVRESDAAIYSIAIMGTGSEPNVELLCDLSAETGGKTIVVDSAEDLPAAIEQINTSLRSQYLLGYSPTNQSRDGRYRKISLTLDPPSSAAPLRAAYRTGYYAPSH